MRRNSETVKATVRLPARSCVGSGWWEGASEPARGSHMETFGNNQRMFQGDSLWGTRSFSDILFSLAAVSSSRSQELNCRPRRAGQGNRLLQPQPAAGPWAQSCCTFWRERPQQGGRDSPGQLLPAPPPPSPSCPSRPRLSLWLGAEDSLGLWSAAEAHSAPAALCGDCRPQT